MKATWNAREIFFSGYSLIYFNKFFCLYLLAEFPVTAFTCGTFFSLEFISDAFRRP